MRGPAILGGMSQRRDAFPEHTSYEDTGCDLAPSCLRCPFELCRYDMPGGVAMYWRAGRAQRARELRDGGFTVGEVAETLGVSKRTVHRLMKVAG